MKKIFLICIFLIGLIAISCSPPPIVGKQTQSTVVASTPAKADTAISAVNETALPVPDTPAPIKWVDENFWKMLTGIIFSLYEFLALKLPTSKTVSIIGNLYKLITWFFPDKNKNGGTFSIRDKLTQN